MLRYFQNYSFIRSTVFLLLLHLLRLLLLLLLFQLFLIFLSYFLHFIVYQNVSPILLASILHRVVRAKYKQTAVLLVHGVRYLVHISHRGSRTRVLPETFPNLHLSCDLKSGFSFSQ